MMFQETTGMRSFSDPVAIGNPVDIPDNIF